MVLVPAGEGGDHHAGVNGLHRRTRSVALDDLKRLPGRGSACRRRVPVQAGEPEPAGPVAGPAGSGLGLLPVSAWEGPAAVAGLAVSTVPVAPVVEIDAVLAVGSAFRLSHTESQQLGSHIGCMPNR